MRLDRESASRFECRLRDVVSGTGPFGKPCPVSSRNSGTQFPSEVPWGKSDPEFAWIVGRTFRRAVPPQLRRVATRCITTCKSATLVQHASVAQGIEHRSPKAGVDGSNPPGGTRDLPSPVPPRCRALLVQCHVKNEAPACWGSKRAPVSEYVCGESRNERLGCD